MNLLPDRPAAGGDQAGGDGDGGLRAPSTCSSSVRGAATARGRLQRIEHLGDQSHFHLAVGDHTLVTLGDPASELRTGDRIDIRLESPLFFDGDGDRIAVESV